jgi:hypothetical protein
VIGLAFVPQTPGIDSEGAHKLRSACVECPAIGRD